MPTCTPGSTTTTHYGFCMPADGETNWGTAYRTTMQAIDTAIFNTGIPRSYLAGLQTTPTQATTSVSIAAGVCMGNDQATPISLTSTLVKILSSSWAVGTGNGGLYAATSIQGGQTYHLFVILRTDTSVVDAYFDTVATAVNIPSPYTIYRRIASMTTATSTNLNTWVQDGDYFGMATPIQDFVDTNPGTSAVTKRLMSVPNGVALQVMMHVQAFSTTSNPMIYVSDLGTQDMAPSLSGTPLVDGGGTASTLTVTMNMMVQKRTNVSGQIRYRLTTSDGATTVKIVSLGWFDRRGRDD